MTRRRPTQRERVLRALTRAGRRGITAVDFSAPDVCDGLDPIIRLPSRIDELRSAGHRIEVRGRRHRCAVYVLEAPPERPSPPTTREGPAPSLALEVAPPPPASPFDPRGGFA